MKRFLALALSSALLHGNSTAIAQTAPPPGQSNYPLVPAPAPGAAGQSSPPNQTPSVAQQSPAQEPAPPPAAQSATPPAYLPPSPMGPAWGPVPGSDPEYLDITTPQLQRELDATGLAAPITFLVLGVPSLVFGGAWLARSIVRFDECKRYAPSQFDGYYYYEDSRKGSCQTTQVLGIVFSSLLIAFGLPLTTVGSIMLPSRLSKRSSMSRELKLRESYRQGAHLQINHGPMWTSGGGVSYGISGRF